MIHFKIRANEQMLSITAGGHEFEDGCEVCARVTTFLELFYISFKEHVDAHEKANGYTFISVNTFDLDNNLLTKFLNYLVDLQKLYKKSITIKYEVER